MAYSKNWLMVVVLACAGSVQASELLSGKGLDGSGWDVVGALHSGHLSSSSDLGSDVKTDVLSVRRDIGGGRTQVLTFGAFADTPPAGSRSAGGRAPQLVSGRVSNQEDTFVSYLGFGESYRYRPDAEVNVDFRVGSVNGIAVPLVRGFWDAEHRATGVDDTRHSPLSSQGRPYVQAGVLQQAEILGAAVGSVHMGLSYAVAGVLGDYQAYAGAGLIVSALDALDLPSLPVSATGVITPAPQHSGVFAGVYGQAIGYDLATRDVGTKPFQAKALAGGKYRLKKR